MSAAQVEYCDIVMKGGITSGIVYPNAMLALAERYTFKNTGGTSAGAIAAAALAAAALGERRRLFRPESLAKNTESVGFQGLKTVADTLKTKGFILGLFQPAAGTGQALKLILRLTRNSNAWTKIAGVVGAIFGLAPTTLILAASMPTVLALFAGGWLSAAVTVIPALIFAFVLAAFIGLRALAAAVRSNNLGVCSGANQNGSGQDGLTDWLHKVIQDLAGTTDRPPVFRDLWEAPPYPDEPGEKRLSLEMITTGISHHEPRRLPFESSRFWFRRDEFVRLFPVDVVNWMTEQDQAPLTIEGTRYFQLPEDGKLPVIVATRMSPSFPLLLSAVPLYEGVWQTGLGMPSKAATTPNDQAKSLGQASDNLANGGKRSSRRPQQLRICWFSDGGISSNFPVHLFDAPLPRWPTFAIDLVYPDANKTSSKQSVFLPTENNQSWQRRYTSIASPSATSEISAFLFGIIGTMQNWRDGLQSRAPGHRDRIVTVALAGDEGGLNLDMPGSVLDRIADKGTKAGRMLAKEFEFDNHWWIRWRIAASAIERFTISFAATASTTPTASYRDAWLSARNGTPNPPSYAFTAAQAMRPHIALSQWSRKANCGRMS